ncbi:MAG: AarF/ABC1/UbiB kinase family protein, partial [Pseudomonadota bacterium]
NAEGQYCWARSRLMHRAGKRGAKSAASKHFTPPNRDFALIARKLTGVFTFITVLEAEFNAHDLVAAHIARWRARETRGQA